MGHLIWEYVIRLRWVANKRHPIMFFLGFLIVNVEIYVTNAAQNVFCAVLVIVVRRHTVGSNLTYYGTASLYPRRNPTLLWVFAVRVVDFSVALHYLFRKQQKSYNVLNHRQEKCPIRCRRCHSWSLMPSIPSITPSNGSRQWVMLLGCATKKRGGIFAWGNPEEFGDVSKNENDYIMVCRLLYTSTDIQF